MKGIPSIADDNDLLPEPNVSPVHDYRYITPSSTHSHALLFHDSTLHIVHHISSQLLPCSSLLLLIILIKSANGATALLPTRHCLASMCPQRGQPRERDGLKTREKKREQRAALWGTWKWRGWKDKSIKINQVKEGDWGKREKWGEKRRFCHVGWKLCLLGSG